MIGLTVLNRYALLGTAEAFRAAITALATRVEAEGHPGVLGYRFFLDPERGEARAVIDYADDAAWLGHHDIAMGWPEMTALHAAARLDEITFLGAVTPAIRAWIDGSTLTARVTAGYAPVAGFLRQGR
ncbi:putative quinol monooxygenase [Mesobacterium pallidum]|uniref:putative quinol monooxygenase n=1 Tax=Mesobacterium pallidum TaxID=2872037 RepID=UPI001EE2EFF3|nr:antibiotic biosynthesis monooxygenase [Mesobacterium pallidum]